LSSKASPFVSGSGGQAQRAQAILFPILGASMGHMPAPISPLENAPKQGEDVVPTTVMLRNLPKTYTRNMLVALLDDKGFSRQYDFVYVPISFKSHLSVGYAFVNLVDHGVAIRLMKTMHGFAEWPCPSKEICEPCWSNLQGLQANVMRYKDSPVMVKFLPSEFKPAVFQEGVEVAFPEPMEENLLGSRTSPGMKRALAFSKRNARTF